MLFDKYVTVEYRTVSGTYGNQVYVAHPGFTTVAVNIQPIQDTFANTGNGMFFKNYRVFTTNSGIVEGFRLTVSGTGEKYIVRGRANYGYIVLPHFELVAERDDR